MSGISSVAGAIQAPMSRPVNRAAPEGSSMEEAKESPAEKAREQHSSPQAATAPVSSSKGVGGVINLKV
jgi:hypothetical protein